MQLSLKRIKAVNRILGIIQGRDVNEKLKVYSGLATITGVHLDGLMKFGLIARFDFAIREREGEKIDAH